MSVFWGVGEMGPGVSLLALNHLARVFWADKPAFDIGIERTGSLDQGNISF